MSASHPNVIHAWANKHSSPQTGCNVFFDGDTLFSYGRHFILGLHLPWDNLVLLSNDIYSVSTSKHQSITRGAVSHLNVLFLPESCLRIMHNQPSDATIDQLKETLAKLIDSECRDMIHEINKLSENSRSLGSSEQGWKIRNFEALNYAGRRFLESFYDHWHYELFHYEMSVYHEKLNHRINNNLTRTQYTDEEQIQRFKAFKRQGLHNHNLTYLRINYKKDRLETSKGIRVPLDEIKRYGRYIKHIMQTCQVRNIKSMDIEPFLLGGWTIHIIHAHQLNIGCHHIPYSEILTIAEKLNLSAPES